MPKILEGILEPGGNIKLTNGRLPEHPVKVKISLIEENKKDELLKVVEEQDRIRERFDKKLSGRSGAEIIREWRDKR